MRKIFESNQHGKVHHFQSILEANGILSMVRNDNSATLDGNLPGNLMLPELWVMEDDEYDRAMEILTPYYEGRAGEEEDAPESESEPDSSQ